MIKLKQDVSQLLKNGVIKLERKFSRKHDSEDFYTQFLANVDMEPYCQIAYVEGANETDKVMHAALCENPYNISYTGEPDEKAKHMFEELKKGCRVPF